ncbi:MAG: hypothetical protein K6E54_07420 [Bacteroidaceae bacterium]|nr:hypothetical protein [Bacteroidaceae bacterium]
MAYRNIIGRTEEVRKLVRFLRSSKSEFVVICGRRRVDKSYELELANKNDALFLLQTAYQDPFYSVCHGYDKQLAIQLLFW